MTEPIYAPDPLDPVLPPVAATPQGDPEMESLMKLFAGLRDDNADEAKIDQVMNALAAVPLSKAPQIAEHPLMQRFLTKAREHAEKSGQLRAGMIMNKGTIAENYVPWSLADLKSPPPGWDGKSELPPGHTEWVFGQVPERNKEIIVNGVKVRLYRRVPYSGPKVFWDQYLAALDAEEAAEQHAAFLMKVEGAGLPRDPTILNEGTMAVRTSFTKGTFYPGMGTQGMASVPAAAEGEAVEAGTAT